MRGNLLIGKLLRSARNDKIFMSQFVSRNIFWLSVSRIAALILLFFAYTQLFRYLGPFGTGQHQFVLSLVTIFGIVADLGISQYVTKKIAEDHTKAKTYFHSFLAAEVVLAVLIYIAMVGLVYARGYEPVIRQAVSVAGVGLFFYGLTIPFLTVLSAFQDLKRVAIINFLASLVNAAVIFSAILFHRYIVFLAAQQVIYGVLALGIYYHFLKRYIPQPEVTKTFSHLDTKLLKTILTAALPFALLVSFSTIYNRIDVILVSKLRGFAETGLYTAAYKFVDLMNFFPAVVSHSLYPAFAGLMAEKNIVEVRAVLEKYLRFLLFIAIPVGVGGSVLSKEIITLVAGPEFAPSAPVLAILVWAVSLLFVYIVANALVISQLTKYAVAITGVNMFVNILGNLFLLPRIGIKGAAIMTVVSESLQFIFYFYFVRRYITPFRFAEFFVRPALAALGMGAVLWFIRTSLFFGTGFFAAAVHLGVLVGIGGSVYLGLLFVFGFFKASDVAFIKGFIGRRSE